MPPGTSEQPATHLVVGITVRPLAASAHKAGLKVCAIDLYNDLDTQSSSHQSLAVGFDGMGLDSEGLFDSIQKLDPSRSLRVVYAGGFEHAPSQIEKIEENRTVLGNSAVTVSKLLNIREFSSTMSALEIPTPEIRFGRPGQAGVWLHKRIGGCGGLEVNYVTLKNLVSNDDYYYEQFKSGKTITATILAAGQHAQIVGFSEQWCAKDHMAGEFVYGGAVSLAEKMLPERFVKSVKEIANLLVSNLGLSGLMTLDMILNGSDYWLLEINPRPGSTFELHEGETSYFAAHCDAFEGKHPTLRSVTEDGIFEAHSVIYASSRFEIPPGWAWPKWVRDRAAPGVSFWPGDPVCTVYAKADSSLAARSLVEQRHSQISEVMRSWRPLN